MENIKKRYDDFCIKAIGNALAILSTQEILLEDIEKYLKIKMNKLLAEKNHLVITHQMEGLEKELDDIAIRHLNDYRQKLTDMASHRRGS